MQRSRFVTETLSRSREEPLARAAHGDTMTTSNFDTVQHVLHWCWFASNFTEP